MIMQKQKPKKIVVDVAGVTMDPDIRLTILSTHTTQCIQGV